MYTVDTCQSLLQRKHQSNQWPLPEWKHWVLSQLWSQCIQWLLSERNQGFLSQFCLQCKHHGPESLIKGSFKIYPRMQSECPQQILFKVITVYSQCGSISPQTLKELIEYMVGYIVVAFLDTFWKNPQWVAQAHDGYIVNKIVKETPGFFQKVATGYIVIIIVKEPSVFIQEVATHRFGVFFVKVINMYPLSTLWSKWWIHLKKTQHISTGFWLDKLLKKSQLNHNVSTGYIPPCP